MSDRDSRDPNTGAMRQQGMSGAEPAEPDQGDNANAGSSPASGIGKRANDAPHVEELKPDESARRDYDWSRDAWFDEDLNRHPAVRVIRTAFPDAILDILRFRNETTIHIRPELLRDICQVLRADEQIRLDFLTDITVVDMLRLRTTPRLDVVVQLYSLPNRLRLRLKAGVNDGEPVPSLVPLWNGANWLEREAYDMFGINFEGHPGLRRILLPDDWDEGHPLRKDYPVRGWKEFPVYNTERTVPRLRTRWTGRGV